MAEFEQRLQVLIDAVRRLVNEAISTKSVQPEREQVLQWKVSDFEYTEKGLTNYGFTSDYVEKETWHRAFLKLNQEVFDLPEFKAAFQALTIAFPGVSDSQAHLKKFAGPVLWDCLNNSSQSAKILERFLNELAGGPVSHKSKVELEGIIPLVESLSPAQGVTIRQSRKQDVEESSSIALWSVRHPEVPSAIMEIEFSGSVNEQHRLQQRVEQCIALLRLFRVGSVKWTSYDMRSDSLTGLQGRSSMSIGAGGAALEKYVIKEGDVAQLKSFWHAMSSAMPKDVYDFQKQISYVTLAYDRYSDALLQNGVIERRIANVVMGLEALFLDEMQELSYRLGMRISKVLSLLGKNPLEVRAVINDAYGIRSSFAHGGHLTYKAKKKLERKYGEVRKLLLALLDYLRISIIVTILCRMGKEEFVDLIDDALIDSVRHEHLKNKVSGARTIAVG